MVKLNVCEENIRTFMRVKCRDGVLVQGRQGEVGKRYRWGEGTGVRKGNE